MLHTQKTTQVGLIMNLMQKSKNAQKIIVSKIESKLTLRSSSPADKWMSKNGCIGSNGR